MLRHGVNPEGMDVNIRPEHYYYFNMPLLGREVK